MRTSGPSEPSVPIALLAARGLAIAVGTLLWTIDHVSPGGSGAVLKTITRTMNVPKPQGLHVPSHPSRQSRGEAVLRDRLGRTKNSTPPAIRTESLALH